MIVSAPTRLKSLHAKFGFLVTDRFPTDVECQSIIDQTGQEKSGNFA